MLLIRIFCILFIIQTIILSKEIKLGMSADFSGTIKYLGINLRLGIDTYFKSINETSKYNFVIVSKDDVYDPLKASKNVKTFIDDETVLALIGNVGTPTNSVVLPLLKENKMILFGPYSGGEVLRRDDAHSFNYRVSYFFEGYSIVKNLLKKGLSVDDIVVFSQNDTYGDAGFFGAKKAVEELDYDKAKYLTHVRYTRNTENVESALSSLYDLEKEPKVVVMVSTQGPAVKFINYAKVDFPNLKFFHLSPINFDSAQHQISPFEKDLYVSQVVPSLDSKLPIIEEYLKNLNKFYPNEWPNLISLEGFAVGKLFATIISNTKEEELTRESIYEVLKNYEPLDIGLGFNGDFKDSKREYSSSIWLTTSKNKKVVSISWDDIELEGDKDVE